MQSFDIIKKASPSDSFRIKSVIGTYDLQQSSVEERFTGEICLPEEWNIGLIVGRSGSGKTTIAKELFCDKIVQGYEWKHESLLDDFPKGCSVNEICMALTAVGFSTPPSWLKPYNVLSNGEKMRCDIARAMLESKDMFVFDEFTSVVDRNVAQISSFAIQKAIRRNNRKFIAVTCHYDVQDWLMPDWVFNTDDMTFRVIPLEEQKKNRPIINLNIYETKQKEYYWRIFRKHHYLNHSLNKAARVFIAEYNEQVCAMWAILPFPHPKKKNTFKGHRMVVLPDFQGVGIGGKFSNYIGQLYKEQGNTLILTTSNHAMIQALKKSKIWAMTRVGRTSSGSGKIQNKFIKGSTSCNRITVSFEYLGYCK